MADPTPIRIFDTTLRDGEAAALARLCPNVTAARHWAETAQEITAKLQRGRAVNLDPAALILDTIFVINQTAAANAA